ncbi:MAG: hypothetical protein KDK26_05925 [Roseivivax sp.]|nr:hypothetical protein [Roseivivax sp.]
MIELSSTAFVSMLVAMVLTFGLLVWFFSPATLAGPVGIYAPRSPKDAETFVTLDVMRMAHEEQKTPRLLLLGASTLAQSIGDPTPIEDMLENQLGVGKWDIHMLSSPLQTRLDQLTLIETALKNRKAGDPPVVIAISIGVHRLGFPTERLLELENLGRLGVRSDWADDEVRKLGAKPRDRSMFYIVENFRFVVNDFPASFLRLVSRNASSRQIASYSPGTELPDIYRPRDLTKAQIDFGQYNLETYVEFFARLNERIAGMQNVHLIFIDERLSPGFLASRGMQPLADWLNGRFAARVAQFGAPYIEFMKSAGLSSSDYYDDYHLKNGEPQRRARAAFASEFATFVKTCLSGAT